MNVRLLFFALMLIIIACQSDNFDEISTEALPFEPIILKEGSQMSYHLKQQVTDVAEGFGLVVKDEFGHEQYYLSSDTISLCVVDTSYAGGKRVITTNVIASFTKFHVLFNIDEDGNEYAITGYISERKDDERTLYVGGFPFTPKCSQTIPTILNIEERTDQYIKGTFEAEFFVSIAASLIPPAPDNCDEWESVGIMRAAFDVPLSICE